MQTRTQSFASFAVAALCVAAVSAMAHGTVIFQNRENVNLMNSYAATVTADKQVIFPGLDANNLRASYMDGSFWDSGSNAGTNALDINFGTTRNVKTINLEQFPGFEGTSFTVLSSSDGGATYTPQTTMPLSGTSGHPQISLNTAVDTQYLRLVANASNGGNRWVVNALRVLGDTGTLTDTTKTLDIVSGTGGPGNGSVSLTLNGSVSMTDTSNSEFINDSLSPIQRQVMFNMGTNDGFTLQWGSGLPIDFARVGLYFVVGHDDTGATFTIDTSSDGTNFTNALTQVGGIHDGLNYFDLTNPTRGNYLRFTYTNTGGTDNRISDVQVFGDFFVPEPSTFAVGGSVFGLLSLRRRSR